MSHDHQDKPVVSAKVTGETLVGSDLVYDFDRLQHFLKNKQQVTSGGSHLIEIGLASQNQEIIKKGWQVVKINQAHINRCVGCLMMKATLGQEWTTFRIQEVTAEALSIFESQFLNGENQLEIEVELPEMSLTSNFPLLKLTLAKFIGIFANLIPAEGRFKLRLDADQESSTRTLRLTLFEINLDLEALAENPDSVSEFMDHLDWQTAIMSIELLGGKVMVQNQDAPPQTQVIIYFAN